MPQASNATIDRLRRGPPEIEWFLAVAPWGDPVFRARINDVAITQGARTIEFDNATGSYLDVEPGMTLWVGNAWNTYDVGTVRVRAVDSDTLIVAENDDILWSDGLWLTVPGEAGFREPWSVLPRMTEAGGVVTFYKDYEKVYVNEGDHLPPKANGGCPAIGEINPVTGQVSVNFVGEDSYATELGEDISGTFWTFPGGNPPTSALRGTEAAPIPVVWSSSGFRYVRLDAIDTLGTTGTTHIPVWIFDERTDCVPYNKVEVLDASESAAGARVSVRVFGADPIDFADRSLVALGVRSWYGGEAIEIGGFPYRENVYMSGWIVGSTLHFDSENQEVTFEFVTSDEVMRTLPGFSFYLKDESAPSLWYEMDTPTADRIKHHHLEYHTTINQILHVEEFGEGAARAVPERGFPETDPYTQIQRHMYDGVKNTLICDRQGIFRVRRDPQMMGAADRNTVPVVTTIDSDVQGSDWLDSVDVIVRHRPELGMVELGGFIAGTLTPLISRAPGDAPAQRNTKPRLNGHVVVDQDETNLWSGLEWSRKAGRWSEIHITLRGFWPIFGPALQEYLRLGFRDIWGVGPETNVRCVVREVNTSASASRKTAITEIVVEPESIVLSGTTVPVPPAPPPQPPTLPPMPPAPPGAGGELKRAILRTSQGILTTTTFDELNPSVVWEASNNNLGVNPRTSIRDMAFDFADDSRLFMVSDHDVDGGAYRCSDIFNQAAWELRFDNDYAWQTINNSGVGPCVPIDGHCTGVEEGIWWAVGCDAVTGHLMFIAGYNAFDCGVAGWGPHSCGNHKRVFYSTDALGTCLLGDDLTIDPAQGHKSTEWAGAGSIVHAGGVGSLSFSGGWGGGSARYRGMTATGGASVSTVGAHIWSFFRHVWHTRVDQKVLFYTDQGGEGEELGFSQNYGHSFTIVEVLPEDPSDSGQALQMHFLNYKNVMLVDKHEKIHYSTDFAWTWASAVSSPDGAYCVAPCADPTYIPEGFGFIVGMHKPVLDTEWVKLTDDMGQTWTNKTGNLGDFLDHTSDTIYEIIPVQEPGD